MAKFELGIVLPNMQFGPAMTTARRPEIRAMAIRAEQICFDTIWVADELLWRMEQGPPRGCWDGVSLAGAVAAVTSTAKVGSWVLSALHRNPAIIAKTAETLDEISGGRVILGLLEQRRRDPPQFRGAHAWHLSRERSPVDQPIRLRIAADDFGG